MKTFPKAVQRHIGQALYGAQCGEEYPSVKALTGFGGGSVLEIVASHVSDTYRAIYTVRFADAIYVLHAFQKKSKRGIATPRREIGLIHQRLAAAERGYREGGTDHEEETKNQSDRRQRKCLSRPRISEPRTRQLKAHLTLQIYRLIRERGLTQAEAGEILGIKQPHVSGLVRGQFGAFSVERLLEFLTALGQDVEITVRPTRKTHGDVSVILA